MADARPPFHEKKTSDIDIAIVDEVYFDRINREVQQWEKTQGPNMPNVPGAPGALKRALDRAFYCCADTRLPPNTAVAHLDALERIDTKRYCGVHRDISAFIFRDWWSMRNRCCLDIRDLLWNIKKGRVLEPADALEQILKLPGASSLTLT